MIYKMAVNDVARFCLVFFLFILGWSTTFLALQSVPIPNAPTGWAQGFQNAYGMFQVITGGVDWTFAQNVAGDWGGFFYIVSSFLQVFYAIVMLVMLLNLLIAAMGDTYGMVKTATEMEYVQYKAQIIMSLENEMGPSDWKKITPYWIMDKGLPWLQMQIKNQAFLTAGGGQPVSVIAAAPPPPKQTSEQKFKEADADGDGAVSQTELAAFEKDLRTKLELEFLQRVALAQVQAPAPRSQASLFVNAGDIQGDGFSHGGSGHVIEGS